MHHPIKHRFLQISIYHFPAGLHYSSLIDASMTKAYAERYSMAPTTSSILTPLKKRRIKKKKKRRDTLETQD